MIEIPSPINTSHEKSDDVEAVSAVDILGPSFGLLNKAERIVMRMMLRGVKTQWKDEDTPVVNSSLHREGKYVPEDPYLRAFVQEYLQELSEDATGKLTGIAALADMVYLSDRNLSSFSQNIKSQVSALLTTNCVNQFLNGKATCIEQCAVAALIGECYPELGLHDTLVIPYNLKSIAGGFRSTPLIHDHYALRTTDKDGRSYYIVSSGLYVCIDDFLTNEKIDMDRLIDHLIINVKVNPLKAYEDMYDDAAAAIGMIHRSFTTLSTKQATGNVSNA